MRRKNIYILLMTILPWLTLPLIGRKVVKRFLPGTLFMSVYLIFEGLIAEKKKWWRFHYPVKPNVIGEFPLIIGPFFIGSLWIFKFTFGKFKIYQVINLLIDYIFIYGLLNILEKIGYVSLMKMSKFRLSMLFLVKTFFMYGFQMIYEKYFRYKSK